jgi:hypothetical protein
MSDEIEPYYQTGEAGVEHRSIDAAGSDHPFGDEPKEWEADLRPLIRQVADDLYESWKATVREYLANAETACLKVKRHLNDPENSPYDEMIVPDSYEPRITVEWNKAEQKLIIKDNGIGMAAVEVDQVFRHIGRSAARDLGTMSGAFGMGALSFPKFIGPDNTMVMLSHSRLNDDNAAYLVTLAGVEPVRGSLGDSEYGTKFSLDQKNEDMYVREAVERYAEWMRVPVLYEEYDENGEQVFNEDWGDKRLYDEYSKSTYCNDFIVDDCFEAYMSESADGKTLLLSMEIERNGPTEGKAPYPFDVRILDESGKVIKSSNGNEGLIPVARHEYEQMLLDARSDYITESLLSNQDVFAVEVTSDRADYAISQAMIDSDEPLPVAEYVAIEELENDLNRSELGDRYVILGPHQGRELVSGEVWSELREGRAARFVPEDELEPFDVETESGDLCLPKPTADRSSLQSNPEFWKYIGKYFVDEYDNEIDEYRKELQQASDDIEALMNMDVKTVAEVRDA